MKVVVFGASGMVGQGVLRECLLDPDVERVASVVRKPTGQTHDKLHEIVHADFTDYAKVESELGGYDACFFCLGISSTGMSEADYTRVTHDYAVAAAEMLARKNPEMTFIFVSGAGTDSTEKGSTMWARVKGRAENAILAMPFRAAFAFRPAMIRPLHGIRSRTRLYNVLYVVLWPFLPLFEAAFPKYVTTTERVGRAMLEAAKHGAPKKVLENADINALAPASK